MPLVRQHLIDPISCVRCDSCRMVCPTKAIGKIDGTLVVDFDTCDGNGACVPACDTGAISSWRMVPADKVYSKDEQSNWMELPSDVAGLGNDIDAIELEIGSIARPRAPETAAPPKVGLYRESAPAIAHVVANTCLTEAGTSRIHHIVLDLGGTDMTVVEGQSVGIVPPGLDKTGSPLSARLYSVASEREGEAGRPGHVAFTVKRVIDDAQGNVRPGICSNYVCDLQVGDEVRLSGPFGSTFLIPEDPAARLLMICTGTGIAPMRGFLERRLRVGSATHENMVLVYGGRTLTDLPYISDLFKAKDAKQLNLLTALSRDPSCSKQYVQDVLLQESDLIGRLLKDPATHVYLCGLVAMEDGVDQVFTQICGAFGQDWNLVRGELIAAGRFHVETY